MNRSGKNASAVAPHPQSVTDALPSSLAKKTTSSTDAIPITRFSKSGFLDSLQKSIACFVMEEGGSICVDRLGYISKIVQLSIEGFDTIREKPRTTTNQPSPATPDRVQSVIEETPPPAKKVSLTETLADMITSLANRKTRSVEVSRGHNEETQAVIFPPRTRTVDSFLDNATRSGWIDDITPEPHHRRGMLMYFSKKWGDEFDAVASEERNLK